jgi:molybdopterin/thiamine biosynthesis adenylyltransferase
MSMLRLVLNRDQANVIERELVTPPPERLLHIVGRQMLEGSYRVDALVPDVHAHAGTMHCRPSREGEAAIRDAEQDAGGHYIGILHSHPADVPEPSHQDQRAAWDSLDLNPHLNEFFVGVVTAAEGEALPDHWVAIGTGQLSIHVADRSAEEFTPARPMVGAADFLDTLADRMPPETVACLVPRKVAVFGAGSLGSMIAETLARNGVSAFDLIDPDHVEAANLSRSTYTSADIGDLKIDTLADRLRAINPLATVTTHSYAVDDATVSDCERTVRWADLIIAVTDDPRAQAIIDVLAREADTAALFAGVMPGAHAGEIVISLPGFTTCYRCAAGNVRLHNSGGDHDYATGRLRGAVALGADVAIVACSAAKTALSLLGLLHGTDDSLWKPVFGGRNMIHLGLAPGVLGHVEVLNQLPHQHMFQSVWMPTEASPDCEHCQSLVAHESARGGLAPGPGTEPPAEAFDGRVETDAQGCGALSRMARWFRSLQCRSRRWSRRLPPSRSGVARCECCGFTPQPG